jgi:hypothetical protein
VNSSNGTWGELLAIALVGTERKGASPDEVLVEAALLGGGRRAGWSAPAAPATASEPAPLDVWPEATPTAVQLLDLLLAGSISLTAGPDALIAEWLDRAVRNRVRVPHHLIIAILERATTNPAMRDAAMVAVGERGRWVARHNPQWSWLHGADDAWEVGMREQRLALLRRVRAGDKQAALTLIETTWSTEAADMRVQILGVLAEDGLVASDEAFIEAAVADRAASVRKAADLMLDTLPTSARAAQRADELGRLVRVEGRVRKKLVVDDASAVMKLVSTVPLAWWTAHLDTTPDEVVGYARDHGKLADELINAALRQRDATWAAALLRHGKPNVNQAVALVGLVPSASSALVRNLRGLGDKLPAALNQSGTALAASLDPAVVPELEAWVAALADDDNTRRKVRQLIQALTVRASIAKELP